MRALSVWFVWPLLALPVLLSSCQTTSPASAGAGADGDLHNPMVRQIVAVNRRLERVRSLIEDNRLAEAEQLLATLREQPHFQREIEQLSEEVASRRHEPELARQQRASEHRAISEVGERLVLPRTYGETRVITADSVPDHFPTGPMEALINRPVTFNVENADVRTLLLALSELDDVNLIADEALTSDQSLTIKVKDTPLREILSYISRNMGIDFNIGEHVIWVTAAEDVQGGGPKLDTLIYRLKSGYINKLNPRRQDQQQQQQQGGGRGGRGGRGQQGGFGGFSDFASQLGANGEEEQDLNAQDDLLVALEDFLSSVDSPEGSQFRIYRNRNLLLIRDSVENVRLSEQIIKAFDKAPIQVLIEASFLTIGQDDLYQLGTTINSVHYEEDQFKNLEVNGASQLPAFATAVSNPGRLGVAGVIDHVTYDAVLEALQQLRSSRNLSAPRVTVINNQQARLRRGEKRYYFDEFEIESSGGENPVIATVPSGQAQELETGITLEVTPSVGNDLRSIILAIQASIVDFIEFVPLSEDITLPVTDENSVRTAVVVNSGETVVLGGMLSAQQNHSVSQIPILGDIPVIGVLFRKKEDVDTPVHLLIFLTATIIDPDGRYNTVVGDGGALSPKLN